MVFRSVLLLAAFHVAAQDPRSPPDVTLEIVQRKLDAAPSLEIDETVKKDVVGALSEALESLRQADRWNEKQRALDAEIAAAPAELLRIRAELSQPPVAPAVEPPVGAELKALEQAQSRAEGDLAAARQVADQLADEPARRQARRAELTEQLAKTRAAIAELSAALADPASHAALAEARELALGARRKAVEAQVAAAERELAALDETRDLSAARRDQQARRVTSLESIAQQWQAIVAQRREQLAAAARDEAERMRRETAQRDPALQKLAAENEEMTRALAALGAELQEARVELQDRKDRLLRLADRFRNSRRKVEAAGVSVAVGMLLRRELEQFGDAAKLNASIARTQARLSQAQYDALAYEERRAAEGDVEARLPEVLASVDPAALARDRADIEALARELLSKRRETLDALLGDNSTLFDTLVDLDARGLELRDLADRFRQFIEENILWVPSVSPREKIDLSRLADAFAWLADGGAWSRTVAAMHAHVIANPLGASWYCAAMLGLVAIGLLANRLLVRRPRDIEKLAHPSAATFVALVRTVVCGAAPAAVLLLMGSMLRELPDPPHVALALAMGLKSVGVTLLFGLVLLRAAAADGVCRVELAWSALPLARLRREFGRLLVIALPAGFLVGAMESQGMEVRNESLGRVAFLIGMAAFAVFVVRFLRPFPRQPGREHVDFDFPLRSTWRFAGFALPASLAALTLLGYSYTALELYRRLVLTAWIVFAVSLLYSFLLQWLRLAHRATATPSAAPPAARAEARPVAATPEPDEDEEERRASEAQTRRLFRAVSAAVAVVALYAVWSDVLPALRMLDRIAVWPPARIGALDTATMPAAPVASAQGSAVETGAPSPGAMPGAMTSGLDSGRTAPPTAVGVITLGEAGLALVLALLTIIASSNIPGLFEFVLLRRVAMEPSTRYAIASVARYLILVIGVMATAGAIGIDWPSVQWLVAALTFGLAFGLQEIFANFVSGLIILIERPLRVGDLVTVNGIEGQVTQIHMRATTIMNADRKELVVPNKLFVTDQFLNWTLSDRVTRHTVKVGVAYGTDVKKALTILLQIARAHHSVQRKPRPQALFVGFGESSLDFELRVFAQLDDDAVFLKHDLMLEIDEQFRAAGIEIPFPQRELRVRSVPPELLSKREPDEPR